MSTARPIGDEDYEALAAFRLALRRFLTFSEAAARDRGLTAQQHQAILTIKGHGSGRPLTIGELADHLLIRHHSAVELVDRLVQAELATRASAEDDRRRVVVALTAKAEVILRELSATHLDELRRSRTLLEQLLERLGPP
ncbi:MAG TPA: MarR family transcriptional regulator [Aliidongia sp.]|uniref:MarR family winged helix-turn-helix transcriptional regulator n=1 Tax=Aliidongia sp. TaxID=1914230 RepID=UPI002DDD4395|nr:MarR family transcriptional regulator [Aliidongia sp.]HEV2673314.1 MarR family transcriptional regulator [Aliidongia sp.]